MSHTVIILLIVKTLWGLARPGRVKCTFKSLKNFCVILKYVCFIRKMSKRIHVLLLLIVKSGICKTRRCSFICFNKLVATVASLLIILTFKTMWGHPRPGRSFQTSPSAVTDQRKSVVTHELCRITRGEASVSHLAIVWGSKLWTPCKDID